MRRTRISVIAVFFAMACPALPGQNALYVNDSGQNLRLAKSFEEISKSLTHGNWNQNGFGSGIPTYDPGIYRFHLEPVASYFPAYVSVEVTQARFENQDITSVHRLNKRFSFRARFRSAYALNAVMVVLAFDTTDIDSRYYARGLGKSELQEGTILEADLPLPQETPNTWQIHVFSEALEVFNSTLPRATVEKALGKMAAERIKGATNAGAKPLTGPMPPWPAAAAKSRIPGRAVVTCTIGASGQPLDLKLKSATDPVFGEAALAVMPQWWFLPKVVDGKAVASPAELPFEFTPPK